jgi:hypothetical protein
LTSNEVIVLNVEPNHIYQVKFVDMFGWLKGKTEEEKLALQYKDLLKQAYDLSTVDRAASDLKRAEAEEVGKLLDQIRQKN